MKHILITLTSAILLGNISGILAVEAAAAESETVAFKYDANQSADDIYKTLRRQARRICDINYSPKQEGICVNGYLQEVIGKIGAPRLIALHDSKMGKDKRTRQFMLAKNVNPKTQLP